MNSTLQAAASVSNYNTATASQPNILQSERFRITVDRPPYGGINHSNKKGMQPR